MTPTNSTEGRAAVLAQYDEFARLARSAAAMEELENVRQKHMTSALSWEQLAANGRKMEKLREQRMVGSLPTSGSARSPMAEAIAFLKVDDLRGFRTTLARGSRIMIG